MKHNLNRVIETQEIQTVPDFVALSKALQSDMLEAAQHIRNALYDNPEIKTLEIALIALDFAHFIPIANTTEALLEARDCLSEEWFDIDDLYQSMALMDKIDDLDAEIERRSRPIAATHEAAMARYNELYSNQTYTAFRDEAFLRLLIVGDYDTVDICNLLTDAAIEMCHIAIGADVPDYYDGKTGKLGFLLYRQRPELNQKARSHLFNFASRQLVDARYDDGKKDGE